VAAATEGALNIVYGVNHDRYDPAQHHLVTAASCTTNCLAPVVKVMHGRIGWKLAKLYVLAGLAVAWVGGIVLQRFRPER
jgi:glyceraldehyde-3-phosphate dehydrogenase/erythrose-4-phosphate dehydrogenase